MVVPDDCLVIDATANLAVGFEVFFVEVIVAGVDVPEFNILLVNPVLVVVEDVDVIVDVGDIVVVVASKDLSLSSLLMFVTRS